MQTNLECWGSDESWDLWREESEGGRKKKNTQSMKMAQDQSRAKKYLQITFQASWSVQRVVCTLSGHFKSEFRLLGGSAYKS